MTNKSGVFRNYHSWLSLGQRLLDALAVFALLPVLCMLRGIQYDQRYQVISALGALLTWSAMGAMDAYRPWRIVKLQQEIRVILGAWLLVAGGLLFVVWAVKLTEHYSRIVVGLWFVISPLMLVLLHTAERIFLHALRRNGRNTRTAVIVGAGILGGKLAARILTADWMGIRILGFFDDDVKKKGKRVQGIPVIGTCTDAPDYVKRLNVDQVYLALPMHSEKRMREVFDALEDRTASIYIVPDLFIFKLMGAREQNIAGMPVFSLCESPITGPFGIAKRAEDIVLASIILLIIWPFMLLIALGVKISSPGQVLFRQDRYGLNGMRIKMYKFRTMTVCENGNDMKQAVYYDPRVTKFGAFLRRTSLDELPQFINVLQGRMSVVGPRPHAITHNEYYRKLIKRYMWRHKVKPGITGWAQINGWRGETDTLEKMRKRVEHDIEYIDNWSIWLDIKIVYLTITGTLSGKLNENAY